MRPWLAVFALFFITVAACSSSPHTASSATTIHGPDPDVVPAVITPAYLDAVFKVLNHIQGDATRALLSANAVTPGVLADVRAIFNDPLYSKEVQFLQQALLVNRRDVKSPVGDVRTTVAKLIFGSDQCVFAETTVDYRDVLVNPGPPPPSGYWMLQPKQPRHDPYHLNPTPWAFTFNAVYLSPTAVPNKCTAS